MVTFFAGFMLLMVVLGIINLVYNSVMQAVDAIKSFKGDK